MNAHKQNYYFLSICVSDYKYLSKLPFTLIDADNVRNVIIENDKIRLIPECNFSQLINPDCQKVGNFFSNFINSLSAQGEILVLYFSGHGLVIDNDDFGFCFIDTEFHNETDTIFPFSVIRLSDVLKTLTIMNVIPVLIIDACFSGIAGKLLINTRNNAMDIIKNNLNEEYGLNYALFCSCSSRYETYENKHGGFFTQCFIKSIQEGNKQNKRNEYLTVVDIYLLLKSITRKETFEIYPQLFLGEAFADIALVRNIEYQPIIYRFDNTLKSIIHLLWNQGEIRDLSRKEIQQLAGSGAYGNHSKLSYGGWNLVDDNPKTKKRRLTKKGIEFASGNLKIPEEIIKNVENNKYEPKKDTRYISIDF